MEFSWLFVLRFKSNFEVFIFGSTKKSFFSGTLSSETVWLKSVLSLSGTEFWILILLTKGTEL
ncbi:hypothetical protein DR099_00810 [Mycoplasma hyopneumoniae]|nr:hypothetical protein [Mesomycoplasma hyopneumoniae]